MTKVKVEPGPCNFATEITASMNEDDQVNVKVVSGCKSVMEMMGALGDEFDPYEVCLVKPGGGPLIAFASEHFPLHAACPVLNGITKCIEVEAGLALPHDVMIQFVD